MKVLKLHYNNNPNENKAFYFTFEWERIMVKRELF